MTSGRLAQGVMQVTDYSASKSWTGAAASRTLPPQYLKSIPARFLQLFEGKANIVWTGRLVESDSSPHYLGSVPSRLLQLFEGEGNTVWTGRLDHPWSQNEP